MSTLHSWISIDVVFYLVGALLMAVAFLNAVDKNNPKRYTTALFWFLFSLGFLFGDMMILILGKQITYRVIGVIVMLLALLAGANLLGTSQTKDERTELKRRSAESLGNKLFLPAILIPVITVLLTLLGKNIVIAGLPLLDPKNLTLACLALACFLSLSAACLMTKAKPLESIQESRRLVDAVGWALILPMMLAMLGGVFVVAKTGVSIQTLVTALVNPESRTTLIIIYALGMALFTMIMGNAFAAFPVMAAGIALPFLIIQHHANPAPLVALGMLCGYCGTLMTPMAANFNIVPAALLELKDKYQIIRYQIPTAIGVLICNILLMIVLV
jgi:uncharacterized membrane protein